METYFIYIFIGIVAGIFAGLLGIGGGLIIVPVLIFVFHHFEFSEQIIVHLAIGTSLATIIVTSISSVVTHHKHGAVLWAVVQRLVPGIIIGALCGAVVADYFASAVLRNTFAIFVFVVAIQIAFQIMPSAQRVTPSTKGFNGAGFMIGSVSAIFGVGGGSMTVPFLVFRQIHLRHAIATSSACGLPLAVAGSIGFVLIGWQNSYLPEHSVGFIYWPAFLGIIVGSVLTAPIGAALTHYLPVVLLRRIFAVLLLLLAGKLIFW